MDSSDKKKLLLIGGASLALLALFAYRSRQNRKVKQDQQLTKAEENQTQDKPAVEQQQPQQQQQTPVASLSLSVDNHSAHLAVSSGSTSSVEVIHQAAEQAATFKRCAGAVSEECECQYGFKREEFKKGKLLGSIDKYDKHVFLCTGGYDWPKEFESLDSVQGFATAFNNQLKASRSSTGQKIKFNACSAEPKSANGFDILVFPDLIRYNNLKIEDIPVIVEKQIGKGEVCEEFEHEALSGAYVFVCTHNSRDQRCGTCGPRLVDTFNETLSLPRYASLRNKVVVLGTSHIGGHTYAGNVIIYNSKGTKCFGDWYGYVAPEDVERLISGHIMNEEIQKDLWRGRMGISKELAPKLLGFVKTNDPSTD